MTILPSIISSGSKRPREVGHTNFPELRSKLSIRYPNMIVPDHDDVVDVNAERLVVTFVGNHFARKGGCVVLRVAEKAHEAGLPVDFHVVSTLVRGKTVWSDPVRLGFFDQYLKLLELPNVVFSRGLPNKQVVDLLQRSHFSLLPTFSDTFGYGSIESMMNYTPVIATKLQAIPEFVVHDETGILVETDCTPDGDWVGTRVGDKSTTQFEATFATAVDDLAEQVYAALVGCVNDRAKIARLRSAARHKAVALFDSRPASMWWDDLYERVASCSAPTAAGRSGRIGEVRSRAGG
ncbi:MAG: glycosyltransferase family 4 protein [Alsobacter sp.]